jgi:hypothetical protein
MYLIILFLLLLLIAILGPQLWAERILTRYSMPRDDFPGTGGQLARHLLTLLNLSEVKVEVTELGDHYDPQAKAVRLSQKYWSGKSLSALVVAAHEVGHAIQDYSGYQPLAVRTKLVSMTRTAEKVGVILMIALPIVAIMGHRPILGILTFLVGLASLGTSVIVHLITLPVEWDASFRRALPILAKGHYLSSNDQVAARQILRACAFTYVAASLASLLDFGRWLVILRR